MHLLCILKNISKKSSNNIILNMRERERERERERMKTHDHYAQKYLEDFAGIIQLLVELKCNKSSRS